MRSIFRNVFVAFLPAIALAFHAPSRPVHPQSLPSLSRSALSAAPAASGILGRFRSKREVRDQPVNPVRVGDTIQDADVERLNVLTKSDSKDGGDEKSIDNEAVSIRDVMGTGKAILLGKQQVLCLRRVH